MKVYLDLLSDILKNGTKHSNRTGIDTISIFGRQIRFKMSDGFPAMTTKSLAWKAVVSELLWFMEGSTNEHRLAEIKNDNKPYAELTEKERRTIWTDNFNKQARDLGYRDGYLGDIYGAQWRNWKGLQGHGIGHVDTYALMHIDQLQDVVDEIKNNPESRRLIVSAWNAAEIPMMALPPCHYAFQFYVNGNRLSMMWNQRSVDTFLGLPFNIASYALLLHIVAKMANMIPDELIGSFGDTHIYLNSLGGVEEQIKRTPYDLPTLKMPENADYSSIDNFVKSVKCSDFELLNYKHHDKISVPMAV